MQLVGVTKNVNLSTAFVIETEVADFLQAELISDENSEFLNDVKPLKFSMAVKSMNDESIDGIVSLLYESSHDRPLFLDSILTEAAGKSRPFSFGEKVTFVFSVMTNASQVLDARDDLLMRSTTDIGLIVATAVLSVMLLIVSSVLLQITGGWRACKSRITSCLFEEVEDYEFVVKRENTYPVQKSFDADEASASIAPTSASGMLGVTGINPNARLDVVLQTDEDSSMMYGDAETPVSNAGPLGITSIRKMPKEETPRGLAGIVMKRYGSAGKK
jgi:hypothetical protein